MNDHRLALFPSDPAAAPDSTRAVVDALARIGMIDGNWFAGGPNAFLTGKRFLQLVIFLGCSPNISLSPEVAETEKLTFVSVSEVSATPRFRLGAGSVVPRCPACRSEVELSFAAAMADPTATVPCSNCSAETPLYRLDWRRRAGYGRQFIDVHSVFPHEAVPSDSLLESLAAATGTGWDHCYL